MSAFPLPQLAALSRRPPWSLVKASSFVVCSCTPEETPKWELTSELPIDKRMGPIMGKLDQPWGTDGWSRPDETKSMVRGAGDARAGMPMAAATPVSCRLAVSGMHGDDGRWNVSSRDRRGRRMSGIFDCRH